MCLTSPIWNLLTGPKKNIKLFIRRKMNGGVPEFLTVSSSIIKISFTVNEIHISHMTGQSFS